MLCLQWSAMSHMQITRISMWVTIIMMIILFFPVFVSANETGPGEADKSDQQYNTSIALAREGKYEKSLSLLSLLVRKNPDETRYRNDYVVVLGWAGKDKQAYEQLPKFNLDNTPVYVLSALAKSARNIKQFDDAIHLYELASEKDPLNNQFKAGLVMSLSDNRQFDLALGTVNSFLNNSAENMALLFAKAYVYESMSDNFRAIGIYDEILAQDPSSTQAMRGRIMNISKLGAPRLAMTLANKNPGVLSAEDWADITTDEAAMLVRWGRLEADNTKSPYEKIDKAINILEGKLKKLVNKNSEAAKRLMFDLLVAYHDRQMMDKTTEIYQNLKNKSIAMPPYVLHTVGNAFLFLHQPEKAMPVLEQSLELFPNNLNAKINLFYAYLEAGYYQKSLNYIDRVNAQTPQWIKKPDQKGKQWNPEKTQTAVTAALARAYTGRFSEASERLNSLLNAAPGNVDIKTELAYVHLWQGFPRRSLLEFSESLALSPENIHARLGSVDALLTMGDFDSAEKIIAPVMKKNVDNPGIRRLAETLAIKRSRELTMETSGGTSSSPYAGSRDWRNEFFYYDKYLNETIRPFVTILNKFGTYSDTIQYHRLGVGFDLSARDVRGKLEINQDSAGKQAVRLNSNINLSDYWTLNAVFDSNSSDTSLLALNDSVYAINSILGVTYRVSDLQEINVNFSFDDMSDGNNRYSNSISATQRLITQPGYRLDANWFLYQQRNNLTNTAYFNPREILSSEVTFINDWLTYQHYQRRFSQRLLLTYGITKQQDYTKGFIWNMAYEHNWDVNSRLSISYGSSYGRALYDGNKESVVRGFVTLNIRF